MRNQLFRHGEMLRRLKTSKFRSQFHLDRKEKNQVIFKGIPAISRECFAIISKRIANPRRNGFTDGKQTPYKGVIFKAQHATATCCRKCLFKWHNIKQDHELTLDEISYIVGIIVAWIAFEVNQIENITKISYRTLTKGSLQYYLQSNQTQMPSC